MLTRVASATIVRGAASFSERSRAAAVFGVLRAASSVLTKRFTG